MNFEPILSLDEMMPRSEILDRYDWLSGQIIQKWTREGSIRVFKGKNGAPVHYVKDIIKQIERDAKCQTDYSSTEETGYNSEKIEENIIDIGTTQEAEQLRKQLYGQKFSMTQN